MGIYPARMSACMFLVVLGTPLFLLFMLRGIGKAQMELIWDMCSIAACLLTLRGTAIRCRIERPDEWRWFLVALAALALTAFFAWDAIRMLRA